MCLFVCICTCSCTSCMSVPSFWIFTLCVYVFVGVNVYDLYMFVCFYTPQALPWVHLCACLDQYLHCAWLFVLPVFVIVQRRIQCCWLFCCQLFRMQPPPLLTLPLMGDRRWKSSSHPADAFRFWWVFLFSSPAGQAALLMTGKICHCFLSSVCILIFPLPTTYLVCSNKVEEKEGRQKKSKDDGLHWQWSKCWGGCRRWKQVYLSRLHAGLSAPQTFNLSSCDSHAQGIPSGSACSY